MRTGASSLVETARNAGVEACFANPGTTELPLVEALGRTQGVRVVLGLFEGVCTGAADGWGRMTGRPAATLLHLGPGLANGIANLHNARRAHTPLVNWIGDHTSTHLPFDAPLTSDIAALAGTVGWTHSVHSADEMPEAGLASVRAALGAPGRVATLILPADYQWSPGPPPLAVRPEPAHKEPSAAAVTEAARLLRTPGSGLLLGGGATTEKGLRTAGRIAATTGCRVWVERSPARQERGRHLPAFPSLPYFPEDGRAALAGVTSLVLAGARDPVSFFGYPNQPSRLAPENATVHTLADPDEPVDAAAALDALSQELGARAEQALAHRDPVTFAPAGQPLAPDNLGRALAALLPENSIVMSEGGTSGRAFNARYSPNAAPHTMLSITGGAIGQGLPCALGASVACPDRRVIALQADGAGLYTVQALWSMAREGANVTVIVCANQAYRILQQELTRAGIKEPGPRIQALTELARPTVEWTALAKGFGLPGRIARTDAELFEALKESFAARGPSLIEALLS